MYVNAVRVQLNFLTSPGLFQLMFRGSEEQSMPVHSVDPTSKEFFIFKDNPINTLELK